MRDKKISYRDSLLGLSHIDAQMMEEVEEEEMILDDEEDEEECLLIRLLAEAKRELSNPGSIP